MWLAVRVPIELPTFFNHNIASTQLMKIYVPRRGGQEKYAKSLQFLIEVLTTPESVIDAHAFTCDFLYI
jgi:hypothetical protein